MPRPRARPRLAAIALALVVPPLSCAGDAPETAAQQPQYSAVPGPWVLPRDVREAGESMFIAYDDAPPWDGGAHCGGSLLAGTRELGDYLRAHFSGVSSYGG